MWLNFWWGRRAAPSPPRQNAHAFGLTLWGRPDHGTTSDDLPIWKSAIRQVWKPALHLAKLLMRDIGGTWIWRLNCRHRHWRPSCPMMCGRKFIGDWAN